MLKRELLNVRTPDQSVGLTAATTCEIVAGDLPAS